jgi:hypothetical protein
MDPADFFDSIMTQGGTFRKRTKRKSQMKLLHINAYFPRINNFTVSDGANNTIGKINKLKQTLEYYSIF